MYVPETKTSAANCNGEEPYADVIAPCSNMTLEQNADECIYVHMLEQ